MYGCESWTIKKAERWRIPAFELWCWRRLFESPLDCKEIQPVYPKGDQSWVFTEGLMLKLKLQHFGHLMWRVDSLEKTLMLGGIGWLDLLVVQRTLKILLQHQLSSVQFSSVAQSCPTLYDPMNRSTPGLPVHHQLPEFTQTHVHWVSDAIQPSHPLSSPSPPAPNTPLHQGLFQWVNSSHEVAKVLEFQLQHQSFQRTPRTDLLQNGLVGSSCSPRDSQESSPTPQFKTINSSVLSFLYSPTLTSIHDYWKNHSFD